MTAREQLIQEVEQVSDALAEEVLDFLLFKKQQNQKRLLSSHQHDENNQPTQPTVLDRMGGMPKHLLSVGNLSDRDTRRTILASRIQQAQ